jgi:hypothetical protein
MAEPRETRRLDLVGHIDKSRAVQRRAIRVAAAVAALAIVLRFAGVGTAIALAVAAVAAIIGGAGVWITQGHIADFQRQLRDLTRAHR